MVINGNGFKVAFWVMAGICVIGLSTLTSNVIANDRRSTDDRKDIRAEVQCELKEIRKDMTAQSVEIAKILTIVEAIKNGD